MEALVTFNSSSAGHCSCCAEPRGKPARKGVQAGGATWERLPSTSCPDINSSQNRTAALACSPRLWATGTASRDPHSNPIRMASAGNPIVQMRKQRRTEVSPKNDTGEPKFNHSSLCCLWAQTLYFFNSDTDTVSCSVVPNSLWPHGLQPTRLLCPGDFPGKDTGGVCHFLLQGIFLTQGLNLGLLHCRQILYLLSYQGIADVGGEGNGTHYGVYGVAQSRTRLKRLSTSSSSWSRTCWH